MPCNTKATLCVPKGVGAGPSVYSSATHRLVLDGGEGEVEGFVTPGSRHFCAAQPVGCGVAGAARTLEVQAR